MITTRRSDERGQANHGWLESQHTFSFGSYYDSDHMGVSALRVINDDIVKAGTGFATHSHQDMEIISYVKNGTIEHKDSMGNIEVLPAGEFQLMTAGTGVTHSEYNPSSSEPLSFLQIWIQPDTLGIEPGYQQKKFPTHEGLQLIASPNARGSSLLIHQNACLYHLCLAAEKATFHKLENRRTAYIHIVNGEININGETLLPGDGATISKEPQIDFTSITNTEALLFDLP